MMTQNQLDTKLRDAIELKKMRNHRGLRHYWGDQGESQHTKTTGRRGKLGEVKGELFFRSQDLEREIQREIELEKPT